MCGQAAGAVMADMRKQYPVLVEDASVVSREMIKVTAVARSASLQYLFSFLYVPLSSSVCFSSPILCDTRKPNLLRPQEVVSFSLIWFVCVCFYWSTAGGHDVVRDVARGFGRGFSHVLRGWQRGRHARKAAGTGFNLAVLCSKYFGAILYYSKRMIFLINTLNICVCTRLPTFREY